MKNEKNKFLVKIITDKNTSLAIRVKTALAYYWSYEVAIVLEMDSRSILRDGCDVAIMIISQITPLKLNSIIDELLEAKVQVMLFFESMNAELVGRLTEMQFKNYYTLYNESDKNIARMVNLIEEWCSEYTKRVVEVESLNIDSDFWISENLKDFKRFNDTWIFYLKGPSQSVGEWREITGKRSKQVKRDDVPGELWQWRPVYKNSDIFKDQLYSWIFSGGRPQYAEGRWLFSGEAPHLFIAHPHDNKFLQYRVKWNFIMAVLEVSKNSIFASKNLLYVENALYEHKKYSRDVLLVDDKKELKAGNPLLEQYIEIYLKNREESISNQEKVTQLISEQNQEQDQLIESGVLTPTNSPSYFCSIKEKREKLKYLQAVCDGHGNNVMLWSKGQQLIIETNICQVAGSGEEYKINFLGSAEEKALVKQTLESGINHFYLKADSDLGCVLFNIKASNVDSDSSGIFFPLPKQLWVVQRRKSVRLKFEQEKAFSISIQFKESDREQTVKTFYVKDLSATGISFYCDEDTYEKCKIGDSVARVILCIYNREITTPACVRWKVSLAQNPKCDYKKTSVGLEFVKIDQIQQQLLSTYVIDELWQKKIQRKDRVCARKHQV
ncbi:MAG: PilZ domain-containing protein [Oligoflexia bacterium]|nr:PilZ domain-containing protein [Oligoflexia bacterium]MBF0366824.1 PilZ domain-containing protein [Oligoflexia bacterium]